MISLEYQGQFASCQVFTESLDSSTVQQIYGFLNSPAFEGAKIRIMPDVHAGMGAVIGFTAPLGDKVIPNVIGVDIGCGVTAVPLVDTGEIDFKAFDRHLRESVPAGFKIRSSKNESLSRLWKRVDRRSPWSNFERDVDQISEKVGDERERTWNSCGTLGGGNHFIEIGRSEKSGSLWLVVHSGSRHFGLAVAQYHQQKANKAMGKRGGLAWLEGPDADEYLWDMRVAQRFAHLNRLAMLDSLIKFFGEGGLDGVIQSVHNFIGDDNIIRKGAISAHEGEDVIIPWNMKDGMILGTGKGNKDWNNSAPHGAGRKMSRSKARKKLNLDRFRKEMKEAGVWTSCVSKSTLDEAPGAYKAPVNITAFLDETVDVTSTLKPVYNFKAGT